MKLSKLFHSLYAVLMFLPVMVIPIFAININQKSVEPISVEVTESKNANFNQLVKNGNFDNGTQDFEKPNNVTYSVNENILYSSVIDTSISGNRYIKFGNHNSIINDNKYFIHTFIQTDSTRISWQIINNSPYTVLGTYNFDNYNDGNWHEIIGFLLTNSESTDAYFNLVFDRGTYLNIKYINIVNGTELFGYGLDPSITQYKQYFPNEYYNYGEYQVLVKNYITHTYNDTDVGSQFLYSLYIPVKEYFNFGNFFGLSGMYDWFTLNIFNGTAPLSFFIVFNLLIYWLFISLFWLIFDILIYVPMVIHKWLDKAEM